VTGIYYAAVVIGRIADFACLFVCLSRTDS